MIYVCDSIMGTGKSCAAINYINEHPDEKFIYITPYLDEVKRVKDACRKRNIVEPSDKIQKYNFKKINHTAALVKEGQNIVTTHTAFSNYTDEMLKDIQEKEYILIVDENMDVLEKNNINAGDLQLLVDIGYIKKDGDVYSFAKGGYNGEAFKILFKKIKARKLIKLNHIDDGNSITLYYWLLPPEFISSFKNVFVLSYLFVGQSLHNLFEIYNMPYKYIGIEKNDNGEFRFGEYPGYTPKYVSNIKNMIHILDNKKLNEIGNDRCALSMSWFEKNDGRITQLKNNLGNCVKNIWKQTDVNDRLWGGFIRHKEKTKGKGYTKAFLSFNTRATNAYKDKHYLMYPVNLFMNVGEKLFYQTHGLYIDEDMYALSIMIQWIWRSAIRDGDEIYLYIPSKRMRTLLIEWMDLVEKYGNDITKMIKERYGKKLDEIGEEEIKIKTVLNEVKHMPHTIE